MGFGSWSVIPPPIRSPIDRLPPASSWASFPGPCIAATLTLVSLTAAPTTAQITADTTLSPQTNSIVTQSGSTWLITGGTETDSSLFHSFQDFRLGLGETAAFDNAAAIAHIFARVTGSNGTVINGLIRANGSANLYLLSPQGISIGSGAQLQLGGSFIASTADRLLFPTGEFSATNPAPPPLLTIHPPTGFQFDQLAAPITLQDSGHNLTTDSPILPLVLGAPPASALQVSPGQSLVLVGGDIRFNGAGLVAYGGQISVGAVETGFVGLNQAISALGTPQFTLNYDQASGFQDLTLGNQSVIEVSGLPPSFGGLAAGSVQLQSQNLRIGEGSLVLSQNFGTTAAGAMQVTAAGDVVVTGTDPRSGGILRSVLLSSAVFGDGGAVDLQVGGNLSMRDGGAVASLNFGNARGGNLNFRASRLSLEGVSLLNSQTNSSIASQTAGGTGPAGDVTVAVDRLQITNGAVFSSSSFQGGDGGTVDITARESILIQGYDPSGGLSSTITPATFGQGNAGDVRLRTGSLQLRDGGQISTATFASGNAGNVDISATDILLVGNDTGLQNQTLIASDGGILPLESQIRFGVTAPSGRSGNVRIRSQNLTLRNNALLSTNNLGSGPGGTLTVVTDTLLLDNQSQMTAATLSGEGGNIDITANRALFLRQGSRITAEAGGTGDGGNITITTPLLVGIAAENSDIIANAFEGNGGNIQINAQSILGLKFRESLTDRSDITASSQFGVSGTVNFNGPDTDVSSGLAELPTQLVDPSNQMSDRCAALGGNQFTATGRGGLPENPRDPLHSPSLWREISSTGSASAAGTPSGRGTGPGPEAKEIQRDAQGRVRLAATPPTVEPAQRDQGSVLNQVQALRRGGYYRQALTLLQPWITANSAHNLPETLETVLALRSLGVLSHLTGDRPGAKQWLEASWTLADRLNLPLETSQTLLELGNLARDYQVPEAALVYYQEADRLALASLAAQGVNLDGMVLNLDSNHPDSALALLTSVQARLNQFGLIVAVSDRPDRFLQSQSLPEFVQTLRTDLQALPPDSLTITASLNLLHSLSQISPLAFPEVRSVQGEMVAEVTGWAERLGGNLGGNLGENSAERLGGNLGGNLSEDWGDRRSLAQALLQQGQYWGQVGGGAAIDRAKAATRRSLDLAQQLQQPDLVARAATQLGQLQLQETASHSARNLAENLTPADLTALQSYQVAYGALQTLRSDLVAMNPDLQFSFRDSVEPVYRQLVSLLLRAAVATDTPNPAQAQAYRQQALQVIESLQLAELDNYFRDACLTAHPTDLKQIDPSATVIYPILLEDRLEVITTSAQRPLQHHTIALPRPQIEATLQELYSSLHPAYPKDRHLQLAQQVYDWLIRPIEAELAQTQPQTLVFVLDGVLKNIPMAVLQDGERYLIERYALALSPGLQLLPPPNQGRDRQVLAAGLTEARQGFAPLPAVAQELTDITTTLPGTVLLNQDFTRATLAQSLQQNPSQIVHLATHGQFSADPDQTFLLTWADTLGLKELGQLFQPTQVGLAEPIDLLVLSACQTAQGDDRAGLGLAGFALQSGARSTIASLWSVSDASTARLMAELYRSLGTRPKAHATIAASSPSGSPPPLATSSNSKAEALRQAQLALLHDPQYRHPYFWSAFVLVGNWL